MPKPKLSKGSKGSKKEDSKKGADKKVNKFEFKKKKGKK